LLLLRDSSVIDITLLLLLRRREAELIEGIHDYLTTLIIFPIQRYRDGCLTVAATIHSRLRQRTTTMGLVKIWLGGKRISEEKIHHHEHGDDNNSNDDESISIMDVDIDMSSYNSDDEAMETLAEQQRDHDKAMRKIVRNDPTFTTLFINAEMVDDWGVMGTVVGRNTQLKECLLTWEIFQTMPLGILLVVWRSIDPFRH
jgi:hypothetical protein